MLAARDARIGTFLCPFLPHVFPAGNMINNSSIPATYIYY